MNNNLMYVGLAILVLVGALYFLTGRNAIHETQITESESATSTDVTINNGEEATSTDVSASSSAKVTPPTKNVVISGYPSSWPSDVPRYPTEIVKYSGGNNPQSGPTEATVVFTTKDSVKSVVNFYLNGLVANGWKITEDGAGTSNMTNFRATKGKRNVGGYAVRETNGRTTVTIGVNIGI